MPDNGQQLASKEQVSTYLYFSSIYFVTIGVLYLWGYWSTFNANILEYISLADILKTTAYPIASTFIFAVIGAAFGHYSPALPAGGGVNTPIGVWLNKMAPVLLIVYLTGALALLLFGTVNKWNILPAIFALPVSVLLHRRGLFSSLILNSNTRSTVILLLVMLPIFSYGHGVIKSTEILEGKNYKYVTSQIEGIVLSDDIDPAKRLRFLAVP